MSVLVRARVDETVKNEAAAVLKRMGLTVSDLVRIAITRVAEEQALPFDLGVPNALTVATLEKSKRGEDVHRATDVDDLFHQLRS